MSRILNIGDNDYRLIVNPGGTITLDPSVTGKVIITGDLEVQGETTTVNTTNLDIEDNIITLNKGESPSHPGITELVSGIQIDRGSLPDVLFVFDETVSHFNPNTNDYNPGTFVFKDENNFLRGIQIASISTKQGENFAFDMQGSDSVLRVVNSLNGAYETFLGNDDDIPNLKWVNNYVAAGGLTPGMADVDKIYFQVPDPNNPGLFLVKSRAQAYTDSIKFFLNNTLTPVGEFNVLGFTVGNVNLQNDTITGLNGLYNLVLSSVTNEVEIDAILALRDQTESEVTSTTTMTKIFSSISNTETPGDTNVYFKNVNTSGEFISKNRALLYSMLF